MTIIYIFCQSLWLVALLLTDHNPWTMFGKAKGVPCWMESLGKCQGQNLIGHRPEGFGRGTLQGIAFTMIHPRLFHTFSFFYHPGLVKRVFSFFNGVPRDTTGQGRGHEARTIGRGKSHSISNMVFSRYGENEIYYYFISRIEINFYYTNIFICKLSRWLFNGSNA